MKTPCSFSSCNRPQQGPDGLCSAHYKQAKRGGPLKPIGYRDGANRVVWEQGVPWLITTTGKGAETGRFCVDKADLAGVRKHRWSRQQQGAKTYFKTNTGSERFLPRFLLRPPPGTKIKHLDGDSRNNCRANLHIVPRITPDEDKPRCSFANCDSPMNHRASGLCGAHRTQQRKDTPLKPLGWRRGPNEVVEDGEKCWLILTDIRGEEVGRTCIDRADLGAVSAHRWSGWSQKKKGGKLYVTSNTAKGKYLHRFLMQPGKGLEVDHWDGDPLNNCRVNLKIVSRRENSQNVKKKGTRGVYFCPRKKGPGRWTTRVGTGGKTYSAGLFDTEEEAIEAVKKLRAELLTHVNEDRH